MHINDVEIEDTYAEGFFMCGTRFIITADTLEWALEAGRKATGFATSIIACGAQADIECISEHGPDGRPAISIILMGLNLEKVAEQTLLRVGQCVMTCPTTACFNGWQEGTFFDVGKSLRYFGDGYQISKVLFGRRFRRIPVMDGEFLCEDSFGSFENGSDSNLILFGKDRETTLIAAGRAVKAMRKSGGVILPFPGGIVRSGSKVGSKYKTLTASTYTACCPTLKYDPCTIVPEEANCVYEIVLCGAKESDIRRAMAAGIKAAAISGIIKISAGNYGGNLGKVHYPLHEILSEGAANE
ncbi:MAG: formylmethanofuran--tetrahydromethanopterin N-formyltransferase [Lachnospiraceae bacterium]|jgi:formylmethanofuran--tetrahydromethanopterin N-formyltransferase|nr:formylmethanofuran--tetrahydromethanopterin N-formyltransferase [Lachnospiraceae bacterium]